MESEVLRFVSSCGLRIFIYPTLLTRRNKIFLYFFTELKNYHLSFSIYQHDAIDIADPSSMQNACYMNS